VKRLSPTSRRLLALAATATAGVLAALWTASPASAHHGAVSGQAGRCESTSTTWPVSWTIENKYGTTATIETITGTSTAAVTGKHGTIGAGTTIPAHSKIYGTQQIAGGVTSATLTIKFIWADGFTETVESSPVQYDKDKCKPCPSPSPSVSPSKSPSPSPSGSGSVPGSPAPSASTPAGGSGGGGGLPVTGVNSVAFVGVAMVLIGGGTALVLMSRRRRGADHG
jgi:hypothetical protein